MLVITRDDLPALLSGCEDFASDPAFSAIVLLVFNSGDLSAFEPSFLNKRDVFFVVVEIFLVAVAELLVVFIPSIDFDNPSDVRTLAPSEAPKDLIAVASRTV